MAPATESMSGEKPTVSHTEQPTSYNPQILGQTATPWVDYAIQQARLYQKTAEETFESAIEESKSRLSQILSTSSAHFHQTLVISNFPHIFVKLFVSSEIRLIVSWENQRENKKVSSVLV